MNIVHAVSDVVFFIGFVGYFYWLLLIKHCPDRIADEFVEKLADRIVERLEERQPTWDRDVEGLN